MNYNVPGRNGNQYLFTRYEFFDVFPELAGVYIYINRQLRMLPGRDHPFIYIGETENLKARISAHITNNDNGEHKCAIANGADCLLIHIAPVPFVAAGIRHITPKQYVNNVQNELLGIYNTPCNTQLNTWGNGQSVKKGIL